MERKLATVLFVDLVASTELLADVDPEVVRRRVSRFFDQVSHCIVTHGGTVEKFAGDAVMAAFGVPLAHEDDAERAVRAGLATLERVGSSASRRGSASSRARSSQTTTASRRSPRARPSTSPRASRRPRGRARSSSGRARRASRAAASSSSRSARSSCAAAAEARRRAPRRLRRRAERAAPQPHRAARRPRVRARAAREHLRRAPCATGAPRSSRSTAIPASARAGSRASSSPGSRARPCSSAAACRTARASRTGRSPRWSRPRRASPTTTRSTRRRRSCATTARTKPSPTCSGSRSACSRPSRASARSRRSPGPRAPWAEQLAQAQPLVLVFEDVHWGEEPLLELIEHLASWVREAPLLLVCLARPELLDVRPSWGGGRVRATTIELEPLQAEESAAARRGAHGDARAAGRHRRRCSLKTEGNPLFVEETVRMLAERPRGGTERIPDTLQALIAARIDRLPAGARIVLQRASVMGRIFMRGALSSPLAGARGRRRRARRAAAARPRRPRGARDDQRRAGVQVQARADPRGRVLRASRSRRAPTCTTRSPSGSASARDDELLEIRAFHLDQAARLLAELDGAAPPELREEAAQALDEGRPPRAVARGVPQRAQASAARRRARADTRSPLPRRPCRVAPRRLSGRRRRDGRGRDAGRAVAARPASGPRARRRSRRPSSTTAPTPSARTPSRRARSPCSQTSRRRSASSRCGSLRRSPAWLGDYAEFEHWEKLALAAAREAERKDLEVIAVRGLSTRT